MKKGDGFDEELFAIVLALGLLLLIGTVAYTTLEDWNVIDAAYFSVATFTTVGYGDFVPTNDASKVFTIFYMIAGIGIAIYALSILAGRYLVGQEHFLEKLERNVIKKKKRKKKK